MDENEKSVLNSIKNYKAQGYTDDQIKQAMSKSGIATDVASKLLNYKPFYLRAWFFVPIILVLIFGGLLGSFIIDEYFMVSELVEEVDLGEEVSEVDDSVEGVEEGEVESSEEEDKIVEPECGDGNCNIGESCYLDCGCETDSQCELYGDYECSSSGICISSSGSSSSSGGGSGGSSSSSGSSSSDSSATTSTSCVDIGCDSGYDCDTTTGSCYDLADCADGIDNDGDGLIDYYGICNLSGVVYLCNNTGMSSQGKEYCYFNYENGSEGYCDDLSDAVYSYDSDCESAEDVLEGCDDDEDCGDGLVCDSGLYYETYQCVECIMGEDMCNDGYTCSENYICVEEVAGDTEEVEICDDFIDNDGDTFLDCADVEDCEIDPSCVMVSECESYCGVYICSEGVCLVSCDGDEDCESGYVCDIANGACLPDVDEEDVEAPYADVVFCDENNPCGTGEVCSSFVCYTPECNDGIDNDEDGDADYSADNDCDSETDDSETSDVSGPVYLAAGFEEQGFFGKLWAWILSIFGVGV